MAKNWYDKGDIKDRFGWSFQQLKTRLSYLEVVILGHYQGANGKAYRFDDNAMAIFNRQYELEKEGYGVKESSRLVIIELENDVEESTSTTSKANQGNTKVDSELVEELRSRVDFLKTQNQQLWSQLEKKDQRIQQLLSPAKEEVSLKDKTLWQVVREWFKQPAS